MSTKTEGNILLRPVSSAPLLRLIALADALADALAERQMKLRMTEARVRASAAFARFARDSHLALVEEAKKSPEARALVDRAQAVRDRAALQLRRHLTALIAL